MYFTKISTARETLESTIRQEITRAIDVFEDETGGVTPDEIRIHFVDLEIIDRPKRQMVAEVEAIIIVPRL